MPDMKRSFAAKFQKSQGRPAKSTHEHTSHAARRATRATLFPALKGAATDGISQIHITAASNLLRKAAGPLPQRSTLTV